MAVAGIVRAQPDGAPKPAAAAPQSEPYVIQPGAESLFADMLGGGQPLPGGCTLSDGKIQSTAVVATYSCGGAQVVLQLLHPDSAPPAGLVDAVADRIRAREVAFEWKRIEASGAHTVPEGHPMRWAVLIAVAA